MRFLVLDGYLQPPGGAHFLARWLPGETATWHMAWELAPALEGWDGVVIGGSAATIVDAPAWHGASVDFVRGLLAAEVPVLGVCYGHQLLAAAVLGDHAVFKRAEPQVGFPTVVRSASDPLLDALPPAFSAFLSHEDEVAPALGLDVLASDPACPVQAVRVPGRRAWGVQFHLEYPLDEVARIAAFREARHPDLGITESAVVGAAVDTTAHARALFGRFAALCARSAGQGREGDA